MKKIYAVVVGKVSKDEQPSRKVKLHLFARETTCRWERVVAVDKEPTLLLSKTEAIRLLDFANRSYCSKFKIVSFTSDMKRV